MVQFVPKAIFVTTEKPDRMAYRLSEVADLLGVRTATLRTWCQNGTIPSFRIGAAYFVPAGYIEEKCNP